MWFGHLVTFMKSNSFQVADPGLEHNGQVPSTFPALSNVTDNEKGIRRGDSTLVIHSLLLKGKHGDNTKVDYGV